MFKFERNIVCWNRGDQFDIYVTSKKEALSAIVMLMEHFNISVLETGKALSEYSKGRD